MIIYIVLFELLEQILHSKNKKETILGVVSGFVILLIGFMTGGHHH